MMLTGRFVNGREAHRLGIGNCYLSVDEGLKGIKKLGQLKELDAGEGAKEESQKADEVKKMRLRKGNAMVLNRAIQLATSIAKGGPLAIRAVVAAVREGGEEGENKAYDSVVGTGDRNEALKAFAEKREAVFKGR